MTDNRQHVELLQTHHITHKGFSYFLFIFWMGNERILTFAGLIRHFSQKPYSIKGGQ